MRVEIVHVTIKNMTPGDDVNQVWNKWTVKIDQIKKRIRLIELVDCWWIIWKSKTTQPFEISFQTPRWQPLDSSRL